LDLRSEDSFEDLGELEMTRKGYSLDTLAQHITFTPPKLTQPLGWVEILWEFLWTANIEAPNSLLENTILSLEMRFDVAMVAK
jgi:hypothetical protein